jgi:N-acetylglutamate synthase-like GNAT family acetyltransferase
MQIRIANRQDEKKIRALAEEIVSECGGTFDLEGKDAALKNIEQNFFGKDGIFIVADEEKEVVGFACANRLDENAACLRSICVSSSFRHKGIAREMIKIVLSHEERMGFKNLRLGTNPFVTTANATTQDQHLENFFASCGFVPLAHSSSPMEGAYAGNYIFTEA